MPKSVKSRPKITIKAPSKVSAKKTAPEKASAEKAETGKPENPKAPKITINGASGRSVVSARNKAKPAKKAPEPAVEAADPPPIETEAPMPIRRTRVRREDMPAEPEQNEDAPRRNTTVGFVPRAARRTRTGSTEERAGAHNPVESGSRFVRMLNRDRRVVAVISNFVPERLTEGYVFIEGEPVIPTTSGPEDSCPGIKRPRARDYTHAQNVFDAIELWRDAMLDDLEVMSPESLQGRNGDALIRRLTSILENPSSLGMVYGTAPGSEAAKAIGYKS